MKLDFSKYLKSIKNRLKSVKKRFKFDLTRDLSKPKKRQKITWKKALVYFGYVCLALVLMTGVLFAWYSKDLPTPEKIANQKMAQSTKIFDRTGQTLLYETGEERRTIVTSDQVSQYVKDATVATEDPNFYKNHGVEPRAILNALGSRLLGRTNTLRGGSTITQQYVKNSFLTRDRSISRKIKEVILSVELEFMYDKDAILTMYLNEIPYGNANGGIEAAAKSYYGVPAKDLTLAEAATLAAIPQAPTYYSPYGTHVDDLIGRKNYVLEQMVKYGKITKDEAKAAKAEDTTTVGKVLLVKHSSILAPHFAMYVLQQVADKYGENVIQQQGLNITTTLDWDKQIAAQDAITSGVPKLTKYNASNGALVAIDPRTGQILAMVGSKDYFDVSIDGNVNVADSLRQPGSSFKPIAYATAFKQSDYSPSRILYDFTTDFGGNPPYIPHNYNNKTNGPVTMRQGLSNSLNIPAVKVMSLAGIDNVLETASDFGITSLTQRDRYGLSLVLGAGEVRPVEFAGAFSVFATGGTKNDIIPFLKITDSGGKVLYDFDKDHPSGKQVLDPQIAYEISSILTDNNARALVFGTHTALYFPKRTVAVKTGTTSDFKDAWTMGYTPSIAVAVWTGNADNTAMKNGADGSVLAAPIFHNFIETALAKVPNEEFVKPVGIKTVTVEKYSNKLPTQYSTETTTDIFATWQVPKDSDSLHKVVTVCKGTSLIAPDGTPAALTETKVFADLHSERPDNAKWEGPVRSWAVANGLAAALPTGQCDVASLSPAISFTNPTNNSSVSGSVTISVNAAAPNGVANLTYFIDDVEIGQSATSPYALSYNFGSISAGSHKLSARITDNVGMTAASEIQITITSTSLTISGLSATVNPGLPPSATITWVTNIAADSTVSYTPEGGITLQQADSTQVTNHSVLLPNLLPGKKYSFTAISKDSTSNTSSANGTFTTP